MINETNILSSNLLNKMFFVEGMGHRATILNKDSYKPVGNYLVCRYLFDIEVLFEFDCLDDCWDMVDRYDGLFVIYKEHWVG
jgi:hypothetical protein